MKNFIPIIFLLCLPLFSLGQQLLVLHPLVGEEMDARERKVYRIDKSFQLPFPKSHALNIIQTSPGRYQLRSSSQPQLKPYGFTDKGLAKLRELVKSQGKDLLDQWNTLKAKADSFPWVSVRIYQHDRNTIRGVVEEINESLLIIENEEGQRQVVLLEEVASLHVTATSQDKKELKLNESSEAFIPYSTKEGLSRAEKRIYRSFEELRELLAQYENVKIRFRRSANKQRSAVVYRLVKDSIFVLVEEDNQERRAIFLLGDLKYLHILGVDDPSYYKTLNSPYRHRWLLLGTAIPMQEGSLQYQNIWGLGNRLEYGISRHVSANIGFEALSNVLSPLIGEAVGFWTYGIRAGVPIREKVFAGIEIQALSMGFSDLAVSTAAVLTLGDLEKNMSLKVGDFRGMGYLFETDSEFPYSLGASLGASIRLHKRVFLVSENFVRQDFYYHLSSVSETRNRDIQIVPSVVFRAIGHKSMVDFGLMGMGSYEIRETTYENGQAGDSSSGFIHFVPIPYLSWTFNFPASQ